jgi:hypothetical protein
MHTRSGDLRIRAVDRSNGFPCLRIDSCSLHIDLANLRTCFSTLRMRLGSLRIGNQSLPMRSLDRSPLSFRLRMGLRETDQVLTLQPVAVRRVEGGHVQVAFWRGQVG